MVRGVLVLCIDPVSCMENMLKMSTKHRLGPVTRPDTRQNSRGQLGRGSNANTARNSKMLPTDRRMDRPTRQGVESRVRDQKESTVLHTLICKFIVIV